MIKKKLQKESTMIHVHFENKKKYRSIGMFVYVNHE